MGDGILAGLATGLLIWLVMWKAGIRPRPARESLAYVALAVAVYLALRESRLFDPSTSIVVAFLAAAIVLALWTRFWHRPI